MADGGEKTLHTSNKDLDPSFAGMQLLTRMYGTDNALSSRRFGMKTSVNSGCTVIFHACHVA